MLLTPRRAGVSSFVKAGAYWALDNDCYNGLFNEGDWLGKLEALEDYKAHCLFVTVPDARLSGPRTLELFEKWAPRLRPLGYPLALVTQDGMGTDDLPWGSFDALFIGGSDTHRGSRGTAGALMAKALSLGLWLHIGRVNSPSAILKYGRANSWDGTCPAINPSAVPDLIRAVRQVRLSQQSPTLFDLEEAI